MFKIVNKIAFIVTHSKKKTRRCSKRKKFVILMRMEKLFPEGFVSLLSRRQIFKFVWVGSSSCLIQALSFDFQYKLD